MRVGDSLISLIYVPGLSWEALKVGVGGKHTIDFTELTDSSCRGHLFSNHFSELHQHQVVVKLPNSSELDKGGDPWLNSRVPHRVPGDGPRGGGTTSPQRGGEGLCK